MVPRSESPDMMTLLRHAPSAPAPADTLTLLDFDIDAFLDGEPADDRELLGGLLRSPPAVVGSRPPPLAGLAAPTLPASQTTLPVRPRQPSRVEVLARQILAVLPSLPASALPPGVSRNSATIMLLNYALTQHRSSRDGSLPLHKLAMRGEAQKLSRMARVMISFRHPTHVHTKNWLGETPLHMVSCSDAAQVLLGCGARVDVLDKMGNTPIHTAARYHRVDVLDLLLQRVTDVDLLDAKNIEGYTALHLAVIHQPPGDHLRLTLTTLIEASVDVNVSDDTGGRSPLFHAVLRGDETTVRILVEHNAAVNMADFSETTPLQAAEELMPSDNAICSILLEKGGFKLPPADRVTRSSQPGRNSRAVKRARLV